MGRLGVTVAKHASEGEDVGLEKPSLEPVIEQPQSALELLGVWAQADVNINRSSQGRARRGCVVQRTDQETLGYPAIALTGIVG
jgi:hypothetical protein